MQGVALQAGDAGSLAAGCPALQGNRAVMAPGQLLMRTQSSRAVGVGAQRCELGVLASPWLAVCAVPGSGVDWCARAATELLMEQQGWGAAGAYGAHSGRQQGCVML